MVASKVALRAASSRSLMKIAAIAGSILPPNSVLASGSTCATTGKLLSYKFSAPPDQHWIYPERYAKRLGPRFRIS